MKPPSTGLADEDYTFTRGSYQVLEVMVVSIWHMSVLVLRLSSPYIVRILGVVGFDSLSQVHSSQVNTGWYSMYQNPGGSPVMRLLSLSQVDEVKLT